MLAYYYPYTSNTAVRPPPPRLFVLFLFFSNSSVSDCMESTHKKNDIKPSNMSAQRGGRGIPRFTDMSVKSRIFFTPSLDITWYKLGQIFRNSFLKDNLLKKSMKSVSKETKWGLYFSMFRKILTRLRNVYPTNSS